ncbi:CAP domain-containing protein [Microbacterium fluvii]|uniref:CAP domain-containing protein n=1 Tax=Microbacterium fluvii TaxID=415215 RepID=A0ABW2HBZ7_9MICO|nr:CAP domain-containing protein [Microbacterium fluvii]MCU4672465.1 SH3 domain-containing protein [Microbacterium fluvii]
MPSPRTSRRQPSRIVALVLTAGLALTGGTTLVVAPAVPAQAAVTVSGLSTSQIQKLIFDEVNAQRKKAGVKQLTMNSGLNSVATSWSGKQAKAKTMSHNPNYSSQIPKGWKAAAENVAAGFSPAAVVDAWMNSAGHKKNILSTSYTHIGIGVGVDSNGRAYYTQNFGGYTSAPAGTNTAPSGATTTSYTRYLTKKVALRASASTSAKAVVTKAAFTKVTVTASSGSWRKVSVSGKTGWVAASNLVAGKKTTAKLNMRSGPSTSKKVVLVIPKGVSVGPVKATSGSWRKVTYKGTTGWVHKDYLN